MTKLFAITITFLLSFAAAAKAQKNIDGLIDAERSFAIYSVEHNTKDAFLRYMDSAHAVVFDAGRVKSAFNTWSKAAPNTNKLIWWPVFAGIAQSGELGFTTGPWELKHTLGDSSLAAGSFTTIWNLGPGGEWKFLVDIGTDASVMARPLDTAKKLVGASLAIRQARDIIPADTVKKWVGTIDENNDPRDALTIDRIFIQQYNALKNDAFKAVITDSSWFNLPGQKQLTGSEIVAYLPQIPPNLYFVPVGGGVSGSGELAYVYGMVRHEANIENYLRVWQKTQGKYKLLVQVLQW